MNVKRFLDDDFLLYSPTAVKLYHEFAEPLPIIDFHNHLSPEAMGTNANFNNLTEAWLKGDHYKWRAMRIQGVAEEFITGKASDREKFLKWAEVVPFTIRNPLFHWTHLELKRYFSIEETLHPGNGAAVYEEASHQLQQPGYTVRGLLEKQKVKRVCTTDDPADDLQFHQQMEKEGWPVQVFPAFRPDRLLVTSDPKVFRSYVESLEKAAGKSITTYSDLLDVLKARIEFFHLWGCRISDHGLEELPVAAFDESAAAAVFGELMANKKVDEQRLTVFRSALLHQLSEWYCEKGWVQQFHLGALRNNNSRKRAELGPDTGWDSIGDRPQARSLSRFLDQLDQKGKLARTILYNLNPAWNEVFATMTGNFNDGSYPGKIQWGAAWWFLDQKDGISDHLDILSNMGLLSRFVGMVTDSRSFLSFPRHEYFRRILCNTIGREVENGELPNDMAWLGGLIADICFNNANRYFDWKEPNHTK